MKKREIFTVIIGIAVCIAISLGINLLTGSKIGYIDNSVIINKYTKSIETVAKLNEKKTQYENELIGKKNELDNFRSNFLKKTDLTPKEINDAKKIIEEKENEIIENEKSYNKILKEEEGSLLSPLLKEINEKVREYGKKKGYNIIFGATENGNVVYGDKRYDITENVLKFLNKEEKKVENKEKKQQE